MGNNPPGVPLIETPVERAIREQAEENRREARAYNTGNSPAIDYRIVTRVIISTTTPPMPSVFAETREGGSIIAPGQANFQSTTRPVALPDDAIEAYQAKRAWLYVQAIARYRDVFGIPHWTTVCAYRAFGTSLSLTNFCPDGNDIDQNDDPDDPRSPEPADSQSVTPEP